MDNEKVFIEIPNELEVKQEISTIIGKGLVKEKKSNLRRNILASAAAIFVSLLALGFTFPSYARQLPIIGEVFGGLFEHFDDSDYWQVSNLQRFAEGIGIVGEARGMIVTIDEAVFDGQLLHLTYTLESDEGLPSDFSIDISVEALRLDGERSFHFNSWGGTSSHLERISDTENLYMGITSIMLPSILENFNTAEISLTVTGHTETEWFGFQTAGEVDFVFQLGVVSSETILVEETIDFENFKVRIMRISMSPLGVTVYFQGDLEFEVFDDLGNEYAHTFGFSVDGDGWRYFAETIDPDAREIIIMPSRFHFSEYDEYGERIFERIVIPLP